MEEKKILFLLQTPPPVHGSSMVGKFIKESKLINTFFESRYINLGTSRTLDEIGNKKFSKVFRYLIILGQTFFQLSVFKPQLCYVAITAKGVAFYRDVLIIILLKLFNAKIVYHFHNKGVNKMQHRTIDRLLYKFVFRKTDSILLSKYLYSDIKTFIPKEKIHICPNGIPDNNKFKSDNKKMNNKTVKILFLSNLIESKGVFVLLKACSILKEKEIPFETVFIGGEGDINLANFRDKIQSLGLTHHVNYLGKKYGEKKNQALVEADIFAFPTHYHNECFPLVLLEAMQHYLPVVSTYEGGIPDIVDDGTTGFLIPQKNSNVLAEKLEILIKSPELRKQMGNAGRKKYEQKYTLAKFEFRLKEILAYLTS